MNVRRAMCIILNGGMGHTVYMASYMRHVRYIRTLLFKAWLFKGDWRPVSRATVE